MITITGGPLRIMTIYSGPITSSSGISWIGGSTVFWSGQSTPINWV